MKMNKLEDELPAEIKLLWSPAQAARHMATQLPTWAKMG